MSMGRPRKHDKHLPRRMRYRHGAFRFRSADGREITLAKDYATALRRYAEIVDQGPPHLIGDVINRYINERLPRLAPETQRHYLASLKRFRSVFGHMEPCDVEPAMIYKFRSFRPPVAGNRDIAVLSAVFALAIEEGTLSVNPCHEVRRNREYPRDRFIENAEFWNVWNLASEPVQIAMSLAVLTGLRLGDLMRVRIPDYKPDGLHVTTGKTGRRIIIERSPELDTAILRARRYNGRCRVRAMTLIVNQSGQPYTVDGFESVWRTLQKKALAAGAIAETYHFHDLRSKATERAENPQELLAHDSAQTTNRIYRRNPRRVKPSRGVWDKPPDMGQVEK